MADDPFVKFFPSDWLAGTSGLTAAERGVYITLVCLIYEEDGPIRRDDDRLSRRCGLPKNRFLKVLQALKDERKIFEVDGQLMNQRARTIIADRRSRISAGKAGAEARWSDRDAECETGQASKRTQNLRPLGPQDENRQPEEIKQNQWTDDADAVREDMRSQCHPESRDPDREEEEEDAGARDSSSHDDFHADVIRAAGLREDQLPFHWQWPHGPRHTNRWLVLGTREQVLRTVAAEAERMRAKDPEGAKRPSAFDRAVSDMARDLSAPDPTPSAPSHRPARASPDRTHDSVLDRLAAKHRKEA